MDDNGKLAGGLTSLCRNTAGSHTKNRLGVSGGAVILCALSALCVTALCLMALSKASSAAAISEQTAAEAAGYYAACLDADTDIADIRSRNMDGSLLFERDYMISDTQVLRVRVSIGPGVDYEILEWRAAPVSDWSPDTSLDVAP